MILLVLIIAAYTDLKQRIIPNYLVVILLILGLGQHFINGTWLIGLLGIVVGSFTLILLHTGVMGAGDTKLIISLGFLLGPMVILLVWFAFLWAAAVLVWYYLKDGRKKVLLPLAPYILAGYLSLGGVAFAASKIIYCI